MLFIFRLIGHFGKLSAFLNHSFIHFVPAAVAALEDLEDTHFV